MNKIKYLIMLLFCMGSLAAMGQNQVASGTVSDDLGPLMGVYVCLLYTSDAADE